MNQVRSPGSRSATLGSLLICGQAREQLEEEDEEEGLEGDIPDDAPVLQAPKCVLSSCEAGLLFTLDRAFRKPDADSDEEDEPSENEENYLEEIELNPEDEKALEMFMKPEDQSRKTLADVIMEKLRAQEGGFAGTAENVEEAVVQALNPKVVEVYRGCVPKDKQLQYP